jgi:hypothetical protein
METLNLGTEWIAGSLAAALMLGLITAFLGERLPRRGDWLAALATSLPAMALIAQWVARGDLAFPSETTRRGWMRPEAAAHGLEVGLVQDPVGFAVSLALLLLAGFTVTQRTLLAEERRLARALGGAVIGAVGAVLAWLSLTAWLSVLGVGLATLGGLLVFGADWESAQESALATRYARERAWALTLLVAGAGALAGHGTELAWIGAPAAGAEAVELGVSLLGVGVLLFLQPAPLLGWLALSTATSTVLRVIVAYLFPASAAFALIWRLLPLLGDTAAFAALGWLGCGLATLTAVASLHQRDPRVALQALASAILTLAFGAAATGAAWPALALQLGALTAVGALALAAGRAGAGSDARPAWTAAVPVAAALALAGLPGFLTAGAIAGWLASHGSRPALMAVPAAALFACGLAAWRVAQLVRRERATLSWWNAIAPCLLLLLGMAWAWTGTVTGGFLPANPDRVLSALLEAEFLRATGELDADAWTAATAATGGAFAAALALGAWWMHGGQDVARGAHRRYPRVAAAIEGSYGIDVAFAPLIRFLSRAGGAIASLVEDRVWNQWIPAVVSRSLAVTGRGASRLEIALTERIARGARRGVEAPAKLLQLVQNGDGQWYIVFAVGSGIALLLHFLRF